MTTLLFTFFIFLDLLYWIIIIDIVLSWLQLAGFKMRPKFIAGIIDPMYKSIKNIIPTTVGPFELVPIVVLLVIMFLKGFIVTLDPGVIQTINSLRQ